MAFTATTPTKTRLRRSSRQQSQPQSPSSSQLSSSTSSGNYLQTSSFLSHAMLKVPSVNACVSYWTEQQRGTVRISRDAYDNDEKKSNSNSNNGQAPALLSAFVELGRSSRSRETETDDVCFALELVRTQAEKFSIGNVVSYIGISMLKKYQNDLLGVITGEAASFKEKEHESEPNGIPVQWVASAPGDFFARFALKSNDLAATCEFYTSILGMECKAQDEKMVCLRYANECVPSGVPITLVFEATDDDLDKGDCFDHLAIVTTANVEKIYEGFVKDQCKVFMKPTEMFEKKVMGLIDPNNYKVVIAGT
jgi:hypothetical protein